MLKIARSAIGPTPSLSDEQARLIGRVANLEKSKRMILLLDVANLLDASEVSAVGEAGGTTVHGVRRAGGSYPGPGRTARQPKRRIP